jgi:hypothetical protein
MANCSHCWSSEYFHRHNDVLNKATQSIIDKNFKKWYYYHPLHCLYSIDDQIETRKYRQKIRYHLKTMIVQVARFLLTNLRGRSVGGIVIVISRIVAWPIGSKLPPSCIILVGTLVSTRGLLFSLLVANSIIKKCW